MANQPKKYKKFVATAATATLVASAIVPVASAAHTDTTGHQFESYINEATELGLFNDGGEFKPQGKLSRKHVVLILGRYLETLGHKPSSDYATKPAFTDLPTGDDEYLKTASIVKNAGVFTGDNGQIKGSNPITREQMAKVLDGLAKEVAGKSLVEAAEAIEDVKVADLDKAQAGYRDQIQALADLGITTVENYNPKNTVTRGQFAKFIMETIAAINTIKPGDNVQAELDKAVKALEDAVKAIDAEDAKTVEAAKAAIEAAEKALESFGDKLTAEQKAVAEKAIADAKAAVNAAEGTTADLKIASATASTNTTVTVKLEAPITGEVAAADFTIDGLAVSNAVLGTSKDTVTLTTAAQTADKEYTVAYKGSETNKATFVGKAAEGQAFGIVSATARTNTEVTVVLDDAPLRQLTAADFNVSPNLTVQSVTVNNNVVTLKTTSQVSGTEYTITTPTGTGSAKFVGLASVDTAGVISNVEVLNHRQLKVAFNKPVTASTVQDINDFYLGLTEEENGDLSTNRLDTLLGAAASNWEVKYNGALLSSQVTAKTVTTVDYVIIESKDGSLLTEAITALGAGLAYNKSYTLEVRNVKDANGGYTSNSQGAFNVVDAAAPSVAKVSAEASVNNLWNAYDKTLSTFTTGTAAKPAYVDGAYSTLLQTDLEGRAILEVKFSEPVKGNDSTKLNTNLPTGQQFTEGFKVYVDGIEVAVSTGAAGSTTQSKAFVVAADDDNIVNQNSTSEAQKTLLIDVTELERGNHDIKIVGAQDLQGNVLAPNPFQATFKVSDEVKEAPTQVSKPSVKELKQVADNAVEITFDAKDVKAINGLASTTPLVTIKAAEWNPTGGANSDGSWDDIVLTVADLVTSAPNLATDGAKIFSEEVVDANGKVTHTKWTVITNAITGKTATAANGETFNYDGQNQVLRNVVVENFQIGSSAVDSYYHGDTTRKEVVFVKDNKAPEAGTVYADVDAGKLYVTFTDGPFNGKIAEGNIANLLKVSRTSNTGVTTQAELALDGDGSDTTVDVLTTDVQFSTAVKFEAGKTLVIDLAGTTLVDGTNAAATKPLYRESVYTVAIPQGGVTDVFEDIATAGAHEALAAGVPVTTADFINVDGVNQIAAISKSVTIPKLATSSTEGLVPQTSKGLIQSGKDVAAGVGGSATDVLGTATTVGTQAYMTANPNLILVTFEGEVLESSALNKGNYKFNGSALPANAKVTYYTGEINSKTGITGPGSYAGTTATEGLQENFVIIELPEGSVQKDGLYTVEVFNITNKAGKVMLPVKDSVQLVDNTKPTISSVKAIGSKQIEVTFDELLKVKSSSTLTDAVKNFVVTVAGRNYEVSTVTPGSTANKLVLTVAQNFDITGKISVQVKADNNGNMHITDQANPANDIAPGTKSN